MSVTKTPHRWADVLRAIADGEEVQYQDPRDLTWKEPAVPSSNPINWVGCEWRIAPKKQTVWVNVYEDYEARWHTSKNEANLCSREGRIACIPITFTEGEGL